MGDTHAVYNHDELVELLPGYALDALDSAAARQRVERHLAACPRCRLTVETDRLAADYLSYAVPQQRPPAELKDHLLARVEREGAAVAGPVPVPIGARSPRRPQRRRPGLWLLAAAVVPWLLVVVLGYALLSQRHGSGPSMVVAALHGSGHTYGRLALVAGLQSAFLSVTHLPPLVVGTAYVCWLDHQGTMERVGTLTPLPHGDDAMVVLRATYPLDRYRALVVSIEQLPLPPQPHGRFLAAATVRL